MALGLGALIAAGQIQMAQSVALQLSNIATNMMTSTLTNMASQQKTMADASAGIGSAYSNGASSVYGAIFASNNELAGVFKKAGGH